MPTFIIVLLALVVLALLGWIVYDVRRNRSFSSQDAIALLGIVVSAALALLPYLAPDAPRPAPPASAALTIAIDGPETAPLGQKTYFTLVSQNATRAEWSIGGFADGQLFVVDPLIPSHQIYVEPADPGRVGASFVLAVTVYDPSGGSASTTKRFTITGK